MKQFFIADYGTVTRDNAVFLKCTELNRVDSLDIGHIAYRVRFHTAAGTSYVDVVREKDTDE